MTGVRVAVVGGLLTTTGVLVGCGEGDETTLRFPFDGSELFTLPESLLFELFIETCEGSGEGNSIELAALFEFFVEFNCALSFNDVCDLPEGSRKINASKTHKPIKPPNTPATRILIIVPKLPAAIIFLLYGEKESCLLP